MSFLFLFASHSGSELFSSTCVDLQFPVGNLSFLQVLQNNLLYNVVSSAIFSACLNYCNVFDLITVVCPPLYPLLIVPTLVYNFHSHSVIPVTCISSLRLWESPAEGFSGCGNPRYISDYESPAARYQTAGFSGQGIRQSRDTLTERYS